MVDYVIKKGENKIRGFDDRVISLYARGMSMREIQGHLHRGIALETIKCNVKVSKNTSYLLDILIANHF